MSGCAGQIRERPPSLVRSEGVSYRDRQFSKSFDPDRVTGSGSADVYVVMRSGY